MKFRKPLLALVLAALPSFVQAFHESGEYARALEIHQAQTQLKRELRQYEKNVQQAMDKFEKKTAHVWGDETELPSADQDVVYRNDQTERSVINYKNGSVVVEIAVNLDKSKNIRRLAEQLSNAIADVIVSGPDTRSVTEMAKDPDATREGSEINGISDIVDTGNGAHLDEAGIKQFSNKQLKKVRRHQLTGDDGVIRYVFTTRFSLVPEHIKVRAKKYRKLVEFHARKFHIPTPLIYSIIETESFFNPNAKSSIPAFGLMQLVPATGARDAYKFIYNKDVVVKEEYLYLPGKNIELGVAYLHVIYYKYLHKIQDPTTKLWIMIAAYNTGVVNVMKSVMGPYSRHKYGSLYNWKNMAIDKFNEMDPEQVYNHLQKHLLSDETREYLRKVRKRMSKYRVYKTMITSW